MKFSDVWFSDIVTFISKSTFGYLHEFINVSVLWLVGIWIISILGKLRSCLVCCSRESSLSCYFSLLTSPLHISKLVSLCRLLEIFLCIVPSSPALCDPNRAALVFMVFLSTITFSVGFPFLVILTRNCPLVKFLPHFFLSIGDYSPRLLIV